MVAPLGPILAQLVTLSLFDRTEGRKVVNTDETHAEASTRPVAGLNLRWKHASATFSYGPSLTVTTLPAESRQLLIYQAGAVGVGYELGRTVISASASVGYGRLNFQQQALAGGAAPGGANAVGAPVAPVTTNGPAPVAIGTVLGGPPAQTTSASGAATPTQNQIRALNQIVSFAALSTTAGITHADSAHFAYGATTGYTVSGATDAADQAQFPVIRGLNWTVFARAGWGRRDDLNSALTLQYSFASARTDTPQPQAGNSAWIATVNETWAHRFSPHTTTFVGVGLSGTRAPIPDNGTVVAYSIYPTVNAGITESALVNRGKLFVGLNVSSAPALDLLTLAVDPRLSFGASAGWARDRFYSSLSASSALSVASAQNSGGLTTASGTATLGYILGKVVSVDTGIRGAWQAYQGSTVIPLTYAVFVGMNLTTAWPFR